MAILTHELAEYAAREANLPGDLIDEWSHELELMCRLVLVAVREHGDPAIKHAVIKERNACAEVCEHLGTQGYGSLAIAVAIRNRGQQADW